MKVVCDCCGKIIDEHRYYFSILNLPVYESFYSCSEECFKKLLYEQGIRTYPTDEQEETYPTDEQEETYPTDEQKETYPSKWKFPILPTISLSMAVLSLAIAIIKAILL